MGVADRGPTARPLKPAPRLVGSVDKLDKDLG
jgi:hypothetical protein